MRRPNLVAILLSSALGIQLAVRRRRRRRVVPVASAAPGAQRVSQTRAAPGSAAPVRTGSTARGLDAWSNTQDAQQNASSPPNRPVALVPTAQDVRHVPHGTRATSTEPQMLHSTTATSSGRGDKHILHRQHAIDDDWASDDEALPTGLPTHDRGCENLSKEPRPLIPLSKCRTITVLPLTRVAPPCLGPRGCDDEDEATSASPTASVETTFSSLQSFCINGSDRSIGLAAVSADGTDTGAKKVADAAANTAELSRAVVRCGTG